MSNNGVNGHGNSANEEQLSEAELAQAYRELLKGEQTAAAMENSLANLEKTLDLLMAEFEGASPGVVQRQAEHKRKKEQEEKMGKESEKDGQGNGEKEEEAEKDVK
ncbi:hypothetical protein HOO65_090134 [Ceratocystis lukuohia]|uniref:Uncharacterized protein n=2 Tax=Ceratocystis TaxID=5157 RepID=A0A0F8CXF3_CERFI|nr:hypothetical protein CFO_g2305 [Ceratocystis platani]